MKFSYVIAVMISVGWLASACEAQNEDADGVNVQDGSLAVRGVPLADVSDVRAVRFSITSCDDPALVFNETGALDDQVIPGNLSELANNPLDEESAHLFADYFQVVPPGCYDITAAPLTENGDLSQECFAAKKDGVIVEEGLTTEVFLMIQCKGEDEGAADVIAAINHEPELDDVQFDDSKFLCGSAGEVCAVAHDVDGDPLDFDLEVPEYCDAEQIESADEASQEDDRVCWEVSCRRQGKADMTVRVYDQIWRDDALLRIEDWLTLEGYPNESHTQLSFHAYFDGVRYYPDRDGDGYGDPVEAPWLVCEGDTPPEGYVSNHDDCDEADPAVFPGSVCDDGVFCTVNDTCFDGVCSGDEPRDCSGAGDQCNDGVCDEVADQCVPMPTDEGDICDDGNLCTLQDVCVDGACIGTPKSCSGHGSCSGGSCICNTGWIGADCSQPDIRSYTVTYSLSDIGRSYWTNIRGDCDIDTDGDDNVPVRSNLGLSASGSTTSLSVSFYAEEDGGDHTTFSGVAYHSFGIPGPVVEIVGATSCSLNDTSVGQNHIWNTFPGSCSFAPGFQYRIDNKGDDCDIVGVRGTIQFTVRYHKVS